MTWVAQRTWATGETVTASQLNVMVRDDIRFLYSPPSARAHHRASQDIPADQFGKTVDFSETISDNADMHGTVDYSGAGTTAQANTAFLTTPIAGRYLVGATVEFGVGSAASDKRQVFLGRGITVATAVAFCSVCNPNPGTTNPITMDLQAIEDCAAGEALYVTVSRSDRTQALSLPYIAGEAPVFYAMWMGN